MLEQASKANGYGRLTDLVTGILLKLYTARGSCRECWHTLANDTYVHKKWNELAYKGEILPVSLSDKAILLNLLSSSSIPLSLNIKQFPCSLSLASHCQFTSSRRRDTYILVSLTQPNFSPPLHADNMAQAM